MMKKPFLLLVPLVAVVLLGSCKKDYVCTCTTKDNGTTVMSTSVFTVHNTKKNATKTCTQSGSSGAPGTTLTITCSLSKPE